MHQHSIFLPVQKALTTSEHRLLKSIHFTAQQRFKFVLLGRTHRVEPPSTYELLQWVAREQRQQFVALQPEGISMQLNDVPADFWFAQDERSELNSTVHRQHDHWSTAERFLNVGFHAGCQFPTSSKESAPTNKVFWLPWSVLKAWHESGERICGSRARSWRLSEKGAIQPLASASARRFPRLIATRIAASCFSRGWTPPFSHL